MTIDEKIMILEYRRDKLLSRGFFNHRLAAKAQRKIYQLQKKKEDEKV